MSFLSVVGLFQNLIFQACSTLYITYCQNSIDWKKMVTHFVCLKAVSIVTYDSYQKTARSLKPSFIHSFVHSRTLFIFHYYHWPDAVCIFWLHNLFLTRLYKLFILKKKEFCQSPICGLPILSISQINWKQKYLTGSKTGSSHKYSEKQGMNRANGGANESLS